MAAASADPPPVRDGPLVASVVGARPQLVKASALSPALRDAGVAEALVHTGQHYDPEMSQAFFDGLGLPSPAVELGVGSGPHGAQTGRMLAALEEAFLDLRPDLVAVFGDTNSTLAGALAAAKLGLPVAHVEAGLRSFDRTMPEEINRVVVDHVSELLFAPTAAAVAHLAAEGLAERTIRCGDVMLDVVRAHDSAIAAHSIETCRELGVARRGFAVVTVHRAANTDDEARWRSLVAAIGALGRVLPVIWMAHPRTRDKLRDLALPGVRIVGPQSYLRTQALLDSARVVLTDSGGLQKEAAYHATPCVVLRERTEWEELVSGGGAVLAGADPKRIVAAAREATWPAAGLPEDRYADGHSARRIAVRIASFLGVAPAATPSLTAAGSSSA